VRAYLSSVTRTGEGESAGSTLWVELTRRNLLALLAKLGRGDSSRTLVVRRDDDQNAVVKVVAVEDEEHYGDRAYPDVLEPLPLEFPARAYLHDHGAFSNGCTPGCGWFWVVRA